MLLKTILWILNVINLKIIVVFKIRLKTIKAQYKINSISCWYNFWIHTSTFRSFSTRSNFWNQIWVHINDDITEQVTDIKYLGYCISEYKSDLEDKLQTYNKINGVIGRLFLCVYGSVHHNIVYEITNRCSYMQSILFHC